MNDQAVFHVWTELWSQRTQRNGHYTNPYPNDPLASPQPISNLKMKTGSLSSKSCENVSTIQNALISQKYPHFSSRTIILLFDMWQVQGHRHTQKYKIFFIPMNHIKPVTILSGKQGNQNNVLLFLFTGTNFDKVMEKN